MGKALRHSIWAFAFVGIMSMLNSVASQLLPDFSNESISVNLHEVLRLECDIVNNTNSNIVWLKDDARIMLDANSTRLQLTNTTLTFEYIKNEDYGTYECRVENGTGLINKYWKVQIRARNYWLILILLVLISIAIVLLTLLCYKAKNVVRSKVENCNINFEKGNMDAYNPALTLNEQAYLLPYDPKYEFPQTNLLIDKLLGFGEFGKVMKATATGIVKNEENTTVAVKMVKQTDNESVMALRSELKIMVHVGHHLNVVNLLGAVTKNFANRELLVIMEYSRYGNLQQLFVMHRPCFIDQINKETGKVEHELQLMSRIDKKVNKQHHSKHNERKPKPLHTTMKDGLNMKRIANESFVKAENVNNDSSDEEFNLTINTTDLICWASQIASGMEYIASRKILHCDLAARNILLFDDNVVKISGYGKNRSLPSNIGDAPLPCKWFALESLEDSVFSTYSDVWAYGIVLWELFSLGKVPYPGMANNELFLKLEGGYRMDKPQYSNQEIYDIMLNCWNATPKSRPSFEDLKNRFNAMLPRELYNRFLELNEPYLQMNEKKMKCTDV